MNRNFYNKLQPLLELVFVQVTHVIGVQFVNAPIWL